MRSRLLLLGFALLALSGCVGPEIRPSPEALARVARIDVVPMEAPPFSVGRFALADDTSNAGYIPPPPIGSPAAQGLFSLIQLVGQIPQVPLDVEQRLKVIQGKLEALPPWHPTTEIAQAAAQALIESGRAASAGLNVRALPVHRETLLRTEWLARTIAWYEDPSPSTDRSEPIAQDNAVVAEIGISNYSALAGKLLMQVHVKLINAGSGELLGRARAATALASSGMPPLPPLEQAFDGEASSFKEVVVRAGKLLVLECLQMLGLMPLSGVAK